MPGSAFWGKVGRAQPVVAVWVEASRHAVHALAPGPERAAVGLGGGAQRAVEGVRVGIGEAGQGEAWEACDVGAVGSGGSDGRGGGGGGGGGYGGEAVAD